MRQNLTNLREVTIENTDAFYVVGATTKEGILDNSSNVKVNIKKAIDSIAAGTSVDLLAEIDAFDIKPKREKYSTFFVDPDNGNYATNTGFDGYTELSEGTPTPIEEYFDVSSMEVLQAIIKIIEWKEESGDTLWGNRIGFNREERIFYGNTYPSGRDVLIDRRDISGKVQIWISEADSGSGAIWMAIWIDPDDPTKFWMPVVQG